MERLPRLGNDEYPCMGICHTPCVLPTHPRILHRDEVLAVVRHENSTGPGGGEEMMAVRGTMHPQSRCGNGAIGVGVVAIQILLQRRSDVLIDMELRIHAAKWW